MVVGCKNLLCQSPEYILPFRELHQDISEIESQFENYIFEKSASKNEDSNQKLTDLGRKKRSNRSSNRVDEENSSTPDK